MLKTELLQDVLGLLTVSPLVWPRSVGQCIYKATTHTVVDISSLYIADNIAYLNIFPTLHFSAQLSLKDKKRPRLRVIHLIEFI